MNALVYVNIDVKLHKMKKLHGFSYHSAISQIDKYLKNVMLAKCEIKMIAILKEKQYSHLPNE